MVQRGPAEPKCYHTSAHCVRARARYIYLHAQAPRQASGSLLANVMRSSDSSSEEEPIRRSRWRAHRHGTARLRCNRVGAYCVRASMRYIHPPEPSITTSCYGTLHMSDKSPILAPGTAVGSTADRPLLLYISSLSAPVPPLPQLLPDAHFITPFSSTVCIRHRS